MSNQNKETALVCGGAGFIGSNMCAKLLKQGKGVICIDNLHTGKMSNIQEFMHNDSFIFVHDSIQKFKFTQFSKYYNLTEIYNFACPASPPAYQKEPLETLDTCYIGTKNLLEIALITGAKMFQASTSEVYGNPTEHPQKETYHGNVNTFGPRACYDEGKRVAETLCYEYIHQYNVDVKIGRIFNTFGPKMSPNDGRIIPNLVMQALENKCLTIYGDGTQTRSFQYVDDLLNGIECLMNSNLNEPVNLGTECEMTMNDVAKAIMFIVNKPDLKISHLELPKDDPIVRRPDLTIARLIGHTQSVHFLDGLKKTIDWFATASS